MKNILNNIILQLSTIPIKSEMKKRLCWINVLIFHSTLFIIQYQVDIKLDSL